MGHRALVTSTRGQHCNPTRGPMGAISFAKRLRLLRNVATVNAWAPSAAGSVVAPCVGPRWHNHLGRFGIFRLGVKNGQNVKTQISRRKNMFWNPESLFSDLHLLFHLCKIHEIWWLMHWRVGGGINRHTHTHQSHQCRKTKHQKTNSDRHERRCLGGIP